MYGVLLATKIVTNRFVDNEDDGPCPGKCYFKEVTFEGADTAKIWITVIYQSTPVFCLP